MTKFKLMVLMPSYNKEKYIEESIKSVLSQKTDFEFQLVVTDDGSTDKTIEIVNNFIKKHPDKIVLLPSKENHGLLSNIIKAYEYMDCEYFCVLDPDDFYTDNYFLKNAVHFLDKHKDYNIYASNSLIRNDSDKSCAYQIDTNINEHDSCFEDILDDTAILGHTTGSVFRNVVINKSLIKKLKKYIGNHYSEHSVREDDFRNRIHLYNSKSHYVKDVIGVYRITDTGLYQGSNTLKKILLKIQAYIDMYYFFDKKYPKFMELAIKQLPRLENCIFKPDFNNILKYPPEEFLQCCSVLNEIGKYDKKQISNILYRLNRKSKKTSFLSKLFTNKH